MTIHFVKEGSAQAQFVRRGEVLGFAYYGDLS